MPMNYISVAEARNLPGLRLVLTTGVPGPWGESAKALFKLRGVPFTPVAQIAIEANEDLVAWTGVRNAPVAVYEDEPGKSGWLEILLLAERLGSGPSLLPEGPLERALSLGLSTEICGPDGLGWSRRLDQMSTVGSAGLPANFLNAYGFRPDAVAKARGRLISILDGLAEQLRRQAARGSDYLVGSRLSAADVHWACFSVALRPFPDEFCPISPQFRAMYAATTPDIEAALDPALFRHRDMVFERHIGLPMVF
jgi:glutathione S-transferase